jgi:hypothetical protein
MIEIDLHGAEAFLESSKRFRNGLRRTIENSLRRGIRKTITATKTDIRTDSGLGRTIWGRKPAGLNKLVTLIRVRGGETAIETGMKLKGLPRLIEQGGQIRPHAIRIRAFTDRLGRRMPPRTVQHPGAPVRAHGFGGSNLRRDENHILQALSDDVGRWLEAAFGL